MNVNMQYLVLLDNEQYGPYDLDTMRELQLMTDTLVKKLPIGDFRPASSYPELKDFLIITEIRQPSNTREAYQPSNISMNLDTTSFYYKENGEMYGPLTLWDLSLLDIDDNSELSIDNMLHWTTAKNIPNLITTIRQISGTEERDRINADRQKISLDKDELEHVIKDQEEDLVNKQKELQSKNQILAEQQRQLSEKQKEIDNLKRKEAEREKNLQKKQMELELLQSQPKIVEHQWLERPTFNLSSEYQDRYNSYEKQLTTIFSSLKALLPKEEKYVKVFQSHDDEAEYHIDNYWHAIQTIEEFFPKIDGVIHDAMNAYREDMEQLDGSLSKLQHATISQLNKRIENAVEESKKQIRELESINLSSKEHILSALKKELDDNKIKITRQINDEKLKGTLRINHVKSEITTLYQNLLSIFNQTDGILQQIEKESTKFFDLYYDMASASSNVWDKIEAKNLLPPTRLLLGNDVQIATLEDKELTIRKRVFFDFLNTKNLIIRYDKSTKNKAERFVTTLLGRLIASSQPGMIQVSMVDTEEMSGTSNVLTRLNREVYSLCVKNDDVRKLMDWMKNHIADIKLNLLQNPINSLLEYNQKKENKETYQVLVIKGFPMGFGGDTISILNSILRNGINAGVNVIMLIDEDELNRNEEANKIMGRISDEALQFCSTIDFANQLIDNRPLCQLEILTDDELTHVVHFANKGFEVRDDEKVLLADYLPAEEDWWTNKSAHHAEIAFGISDEKQVAKLKITQESGQNSAVVIGIPGSGKSVFLHSIICNAIVNYSPDELNLYLIDFSGVEFNTYANHKLPHAKVIAPEAEREFGLSILTELVEEGNRRMTLCRENDVSNIVDLKARHPEMRVPRLLVIIDEFQKIFEIENDAISRDANSKIHIIIQEFRKFGINLILATQRLPSGSILPKDLIANRVVFKSSMNDFAALITLPSTMRMPQLRTGECIYNSESGSQFDNTRVKGFFISMNDINELLDKVSAHSKRTDISPARMTVFRGNDLPAFGQRRIIDNHRYTSYIPDEVGIYFGESIAINETDVCATLRKEAGNNVLVVGGEPNVAQRIAYYATLSTTTAHTDDSGSFYVFNFIRGSEDEMAEINDTFLSLPFTVKMANRLNEVTAYLSEIQAEIEIRKNDETRAMNHIYLSFYAFQLARMFDRGGRRGDDVSDCGKLLDYILRTGPTYGVFTILQVDNLESLARIGNLLNTFNYRIALQMSENDSNKVVGTSIANKLFVFNRPSSKFRAYYRDHNRNLTIKFKPYK